MAEAALAVVVAPPLIRPDLTQMNHIIGAQRSVLWQHRYFTNLSGKEILPLSLQEEEFFFFFFVCKVRANYNFLTPEKLCSPHISYYFNEDTRLNTREENRSIHNRHPAKGISIVAYKYCPNGKELLQAACN